LETDAADHGLLLSIDPLDEFGSLSYHQTHHVKTCTRTTREILPVGSDWTLNKFLTEYNWIKNELNHKRLEEL
jgi:hypothetical protein